MNRAPTVAIGYLAAHADMDLDEAYEHVTERRACLPFFEVLEEWFEQEFTDDLWLSVWKSVWWFGRPALG